MHYGRISVLVRIINLGNNASFYPLKIFGKLYIRQLNTIYKILRFDFAIKIQGFSKNIRTWILLCNSNIDPSCRYIIILLTAVNLVVYCIRAGVYSFWYFFGVGLVVETVQKLCTIYCFTLCDKLLLITVIFKIFYSLRIFYFFLGYIHFAKLRRNSLRLCIVVVIIAYYLVINGVIPFFLRLWYFGGVICAVKAVNKRTTVCLTLHYKLLIFACCFKASALRRRYNRICLKDDRFYCSAYCLGFIVIAGNAAPFIVRGVGNSVLSLIAAVFNCRHNRIVFPPPILGQLNI